MVKLQNGRQNAAKAWVSSFSEERHKVRTKEYVGELHFFIMFELFQEKSLCHILWYCRDMGISGKPRLFGSCFLEHQHKKTLRDKLSSIMNLTIARKNLPIMHVLI